MRTAENILRNSDAQYPMMSESGIVAAINIARKDVLEYLASKTYIADDNHNPVITKEEILNLIKELK